MSSIGEAQAFADGFRERWNKRFAVAPRQAEDAHRPWSGSKGDLAQALARREERTLPSRLSRRARGVGDRRRVSHNASRLRVRSPRSLPTTSSCERGGFGEGGRKILRTIGSRLVAYSGAKSSTTHKLLELLAGGPGFEPRLTESESAVLPLNYPPTAARARGRGGAGGVNSEAAASAQGSPARGRSSSCLSRAFRQDRADRQARAMLAAGLHPRPTAPVVLVRFLEPHQMIARVFVAAIMRED